MHCTLWFSLSLLSPLGLDTLAQEWTMSFPLIRMLTVVLLKVVLLKVRADETLVTPHPRGSQTWSVY